MKIAVVTDDGKTISAHFGRAQYYLVAEVENGAVTHTELIARDAKCGCGEHEHGEHEHGEHHHDHEHAHGEDHERKHQAMFAPITDCQVLIARGMGQGAHIGLRQNGIQPFLTELHEIEAALEAYLLGELVDQPQRVH